VGPPVFKTGERCAAALAGSIPVRLRFRAYAARAAGGRYYVCPICFNAKKLSSASLIGGAELQGTIPLWSWIGDEAATTFSY
jgi:hypothetical protein